LIGDGLSALVFTHGDTQRIAVFFRIGRMPRSVGAMAFRRIDSANRVEYG
jgi:hypothetical protein